MAKALFNLGQRVFVKPIGAWSTVERIIPQWVKGVEEPLRVFYDVGLGREFHGHELAAEIRERKLDDFVLETWRINRLKNRWLTDTEALRHRHPHPGTYPVIVTDEQDWGGWRVPAAEYDRDPERIEFQSRVMANGLRSLKVVRELSRLGAEYQDHMPAEMQRLVEIAEEVLREIYITDLDEAKVAPAA